MCTQHSTHCEHCDTEFRHLGCRSIGCAFTLVVCMTCDKLQDALDMLHDHEMKCPTYQAQQYHRQGANPELRRVAA